jgi:hypothetical protein
VALEEDRREKCDKQAGVCALRSELAVKFSRV